MGVPLIVLWQQAEDVVFAFDVLLLEEATTTSFDPDTIKITTP